MRLNLTQLEVRILGSLMEKELTTPENYPLSMNALVSACNQKSNRDPVLNLKESEVQEVLLSLGNKGLARRTTVGLRVDRYCHNIAEKLRLAPAARAVLSELMLRGPQTAAELRNRAERMVPITESEGVEGILEELMHFGPPLVALLPRQPGRKEQRYAQLFAGMPELPEYEETTEVERERPRTVPKRERILSLQEKVGAMTAEVRQLRQEVMEVIASFN